MNYSQKVIGILHRHMVGDYKAADSAYNRLRAYVDAYCANVGAERLRHLSPEDGAALFEHLTANAESIANAH